MENYKILGNPTKYDIYIFLWNVNRETATAFLNKQSSTEYTHKRALTYAKHKISMYPKQCSCIYVDFCNTFDNPVDYGAAKLENIEMYQSVKDYHSLWRLMCNYVTCKYPIIPCKHVNLN